MCANVDDTYSIWRYDMDECAEVALEVGTTWPDVAVYAIGVWAIIMFIKWL